MPAARPLITLQEAALGAPGRPLFRGLSLRLGDGERLCLVGRNGCGKSSLLRVLAGELALDAGERLVRAGSRIAYLPQDPQPDPALTVADYIAGGLGGLDPADAQRLAPHVEALLRDLKLDGDAHCGALSGGEGRRAALGRALIGKPDLLLLDEPTNHLDLPTIEWLEDELARFRGSLLMVSHDRRFLERLSRAVLWLDRGVLRRLDKSFAAFDDWAETIAAQEAEAKHKLERQIVREERWLAKGVTARRKRNQGRLARLHALRRERADWLSAPGRAALATGTSARSGRLVIEAEGIGKAFTRPDGRSLPIVSGFSTRIARGDRIGIIGPNGAGKTTLVRLLIGALAPDSGTVRLGEGLETIVFDQRRESLDPEATLWQTLCPGGGDSLMVRGRQRHVVGYLRDFLFDEGQARQPVRSLSGGEKSRLLLARLFARPSNLLVMDEPTNDLDMETLNLLVEVLDAYDGTLLLVSHDRDFLDRLVTSVIALEGDGRIEEHAGGYSDYEARRRAAQTSRPTERTAKRSVASAPKPRQPTGKLSYKDARELDALPAEIARLETEAAALERALADPDLYERDPSAFAETAAKLEQARQSLAAAEDRWLTLEARRESLATGDRP